MKKIILLLLLIPIIAYSQEFERPQAGYYVATGLVFIDGVEHKNGPLFSYGISYKENFAYLIADNNMSNSLSDDKVDITTFTLLEDCIMLPGSYNVSDIIFYYIVKEKVWRSFAIDDDGTQYIVDFKQVEKWKE